MNIEGIDMVNVTHNNNNNDYVKRLACEPNWDGT
jgi:hypothetical protein